MHRPSTTLAVLVAVGAACAVTLGAQRAAEPHVVKVAGAEHKLALRSDGSVLGWGRIAAGQLGPVAAIPSIAGRTSTAAVAISLPRTAVDVAASEATSYAVLDNGSVMAWGSGRKGELGTGESGTTMKGPNGTIGSERPVHVRGLTGVTQIVAANSAAFALTKDGSVYAWGSRDYGVIGDGLHPKRHMEVTEPALSPVRVPNVQDITQLAVGSAHVLALTADGRVLTWGSNYYGALGRPPRRELPLDEAGEVPGLNDVVAVAAGTGVSTVLKRDGTVWVWGSNMHSQFGDGQRTDNPGLDHGFELTPQQVAGIANGVAISLGLGGRHTLVLLKDGTLRGWGNTDWGQIGAGVSGTFQPRPVTPKIAGVKAVFAAGNNSFAVRNDNSFWVWGSGGRTEWPLPKNTAVPTPFVLTAPSGPQW